jgi:hypothetical protein
MTSTVAFLIAFVALGAVLAIAVALSNNKLSATITAGFNGIQGAVSIASGGGGVLMTSTEGAGGAAANVGPLNWLPTWRQTGGVLPDGAVDPGQYNDCGETCVAMVIAAVKGVLLEPGYVRQQLGGPNRSGLTNAHDLATALLMSHIPATELSNNAAEGWRQLMAHWALACPVIVLGNWLSPRSLHWYLLSGYGAGVMKFRDPWTGTEVGLTQAQFAKLYNGSMVTVAEHCHYVETGTPTPGTGSEA